MNDQTGTVGPKPGPYGARSPESANPEESSELPELAVPQWMAHEADLGQTSFVHMLRRLPALVGQALRLAWQASQVDTVVACAAQVASGAFTAFGLLATRGVLEALFAAGPTPDRVRAAIPAMALVAVAGVLRGGLQVAAGWAQARLSASVDRLAQASLLEAATGTNLAAFDDAEFYAAMQRASDRGPMSAGQVVDATVDTTTAAVGLAAAAGTLAVLHPLLLPLLVATALPRGWAAVRAARMRYVSQYRRGTMHRRRWILSHLMTSRNTAADLRAFTMRRFLLGQYNRIGDRELRAELDLARQQSTTRAAGSALSGVATALVYTVLGLLLATGHMPLAVAGTAVLAIQTGQSDLGYLVMAVNELYEGGLYFTDYLTFLDDAAARTPPATRPAPSRFERITLTDVSFRYPGADQPTLSDITLSIPAGAIIALVGENGSGKTTLAKLVAGLYQPTGGQIRWDGIDLADIDQESLWSRVSVVTQDYARWPFTAAENIALGAEPDRPEGVRSAARDAGADEVIARLPHGYDTLLDRTFAAGVDLSGGQWQRIAIARGYHRSGPLLICDEPTAALDARAEHALYSRLPELAAGRTVILITHRLASVRHADHIYVLHEGRVEDHGTHHELLARAGRYAELYRLQADAYRMASPYTDPVSP